MDVVMKEEDDVKETEEKKVEATDKVSQLQECLDTLCLEMFNSLRLLPNQSIQTPETLQQIQDLAKNVSDSVKSIELMIEHLPGLHQTESEQYEEMAKLELESEEEALNLRQAVTESEKWIQRAKDSLLVISKDRLQR